MERETGDAKQRREQASQLEDLRRQRHSQWTTRGRGGGGEEEDEEESAPPPPQKSQKVEAASHPTTSQLAERESRPYCQVSSSSPPTTSALARERDEGLFTTTERTAVRRPDTSGDEEYARRLAEEWARIDSASGETQSEDDNHSTPVDSQNTTPDYEIDQQHEQQHHQQQNNNSNNDGIESVFPTSLASAAGRLAFNTAGFLANTLLTGASVGLRRFMGAGTNTTEGTSASGAGGGGGGGGEGLSQIEQDEAYARRLQQEEEEAMAVPTRRTATSTQALRNILSQLGGFTPQQESSETPQQQATETGGRVNEIILPGFGGGIRVRLITNDGSPSVVPLPFGLAHGGGFGGGFMFSNLPFGEEMTYEQLLELQERMGFADRGATEDQISRLPRSIFQEVEEEQSSASVGDQPKHDNGTCSTTCAICLEDYTKGQEIRTLPCMHNFHSACVDKWLLTNKSCPVCKMDIA